MAVGSVLEAVQELARKADVALIVRDGAVYLGDAVGSEPAPVVLDPETNIVRQVDGQGEVTPPRSGSSKATRQVSTTLTLTVLGHPDLRVGQTATVQNLADVPSGSLRIARVVHHFATGGAGTNGTSAPIAALCRRTVAENPRQPPQDAAWSRARAAATRPASPSCAADSATRASSHGSRTASMYSCRPRRAR